MQAQVYIATAHMTEEEWLESRRSGIGGSDAASIAGLNKWKSPVGVYLDKIGQAPEEKNKDNEPAYWGNVLEDIVAKEFQSRTGLKVRRRNAILMHPEHNFMRANVDRLIVGEQIGLECKTANAYLIDEWMEEEVPASYLIQCQHYMAVTGYKGWWIAVLIGGQKFVYKYIERDQEIIDYLISIEKDFWENHVLKRIPPAFDGSQASSDLLGMLYSTAKENTEIDLPPEAGELIDSYNQAKDEEKAIKERLRESENKLKSYLGESEKGRIGERLVTWKNIKSNRFDSKRFATEHPELYRQYLNESQYRRFSIK